MQDVLGQEYGEGDWVTVATISGRSPQQVIGVVLEVDEAGRRVRVAPEIDARGFWRAGTRGGARNGKRPRPVWYRIPENIIKIDGPKEV